MSENISYSYLASKLKNVELNMRDRRKLTMSLSRMFGLAENGELLLKHAFY